MKVTTSLSSKALLVVCSLIYFLVITSAGGGGGGCLGVVESFALLTTRSGGGIRSSNVGRRSELLTSRISSSLQAVSTVPNAEETNKKFMPIEVDESAWVKNLDYDSFAQEVTDLGKMLQAQGGQDDIDHLNKMVSWRDKAAIVGILTMALPVNPVAVVALSTWTYSSWLMVAHHVCHGGYNRMDRTGENGWNSRGFALNNGVQRVMDWCDWILPEAWNVEHNRLHHYHLGERLDPDLVERNSEFIQNMDVPLIVKYMNVLAVMPVWKWFYYAPNTYKELQLTEKFYKKDIPLPDGYDPLQALTLRDIYFPETEAHKVSQETIVKPADFLSKVLFPFLLTRFVLLPAPLLLIPGVGPMLFSHAIGNLVLAELLSNVHSFATVVTNHAGSDLYKFDDEVRPKSGSFYVRQIVSSTNFNYGNDWTDFSHGWLNYQIEHHVWPDLSMLQYQRGAPLLKQICEKHNVPYVQENVWARLVKTVDIMVGKTSMIAFPTHLEPVGDKAGKSGVTWKSTNGAIDDEE